MNKVLTLLLLGFLVPPALAPAEPTIKIGYVDLQRVIRDSQAGKSAKDEFEKEFKGRRSIIETKLTELEAKRKEFNEKAPLMDEEARKKKAEEVDEMQKEIKRLREDFQEELRKRDFELTQKILEDLQKVINEIGQSGGYSLILEKTEGGIVYASGAVDITDEVIKKYDAGKSSKK